MSESPCAKHKPVRIGLLGASFETGNLGVSALAESSIKVILNKWPDAEITFIGGGRSSGEYILQLFSREVHVKRLPIQFSKKIFARNHFCMLVLFALIFRVFGFKRFRNTIDNNLQLKALIEADIVADITAGDSFSDVYGNVRFFLGALEKWLIILFDKKLVMLPQTYGPFQRPLVRKVAGYILKRASIVYSRDKEGIKYLKSVLNINSDSGKVRFTPDVAFILDSRKPDNFDDALLLKAKGVNNTLIGLNISGLLFNGGYTKDNMFGLKADYRELIQKIIDFFMKEEKNIIILVPHVFPLRGLEVESDPDACKKAYELTKDKYKERILLANGTYNHNEIKYIIGFCDFFIGSRMHACIAAMSQYIPTVGLAYSKKFQGVFGSIGFADCIADAQNCDGNKLLKKIEEVFVCGEQIRERLKTTVPRIKEEILNIFQSFDSK